MLDKNADRHDLSREILNRDIRSPLFVLSAVFSVAAVFLAIPGIILLFDQEAAELYQVFLGLDYIDESAQQSWLFVRNLINMLALLVPLLMAVGLWISIAATYCQQDSAMPMWGFNYFSFAARAARVVVCITGILLAALFVFRAVRYIVINAAQIGGLLFIFAMLLPECVFAAVVAIIIVLTFRCLGSAIHTVDNIQLNFLTGKSESYGLTIGAVWLLAMMGVAAVVLCAISEGGVAARLCFGFAAAADFLLAAWLQWYRKKNGKRALARFRLEKEG